MKTSPLWVPLPSATPVGEADIRNAALAATKRRSILGGLSVEAQVRPYVNLSTLSASNISLKPLFFKVTKVYR